MSHPVRQSEMLKLATALGGLDALAIDVGGEGENKVGDRVWRQLGELDTQWSIVLQDDALPVDNFREHAAAVLSHVDPEGPVSFYVGGGRPYKGLVEHAVRRATQLDAKWLEDGTLHWGVAVAIPTEQIPGFLQWAATSQLPYDRRIGTYFRNRKTPTRYTWPSLVDHADGDTIVHRRKPGVARVAHSVGTREDWSNGLVLQIGAVGV